MRKALPLLFLVLCSCISTERAQPERRYHLVEAERTGAAGEKTDLMLRLRRFRVSPRFDSRNLVYRTSDTSYESDFYNEFLADPGSMLTESTRKWLAASGRFKAVLDPSASLDENLVLEAFVQSLYADFRSSPAAVIEMQVYLVKRGSAEDRIVFQKLYSKTTPISEKTTDALLKGYSEGLAQLLTELESDAAASRD
jgi:cholesterol transport system auxiliary component